MIFIRFEFLFKNINKVVGTWGEEHAAHPSATTKWHSDMPFTLYVKICSGTAYIYYTAEFVIRVYAPHRWDVQFIPQLQCCIKDLSYYI